MAETGHAKNVANFEDLISFCTGYGVKYAPINNLIKLLNMNLVLTAAQAVMQLVSDMATPFKTATNNRQIAFKPLEKLCTRIVAALDSSEDVSDELVADARSIVRKIRGSRVSPKIENPNPDDPQQISASQQSYDQLYNHFRDLVALCAATPEYTTSEADLQVPALETYRDTLKAQNKAVADTLTPLSNARIERDDVLYTLKTGLVDIALESKKYVKSVFGASSAQYKQVSPIQFTRPKKKGS